MEIDCKTQKLIDAVKRMYDFAASDPDTESYEVFDSFVSPEGVLFCAGSLLDKSLQAALAEFGVKVSLTREKAAA